MGIVDKILMEADRDEYLRWKRKNVTLRGMKTAGQANGVYPSLGAGLYTVPLSNKQMAKQYGKVYFVVNAIPQRPLVLDGWNNWELWLQNLVYSKLGIDSMSEFHDTTNIRDEIMKLGYDGVLIKGREMVSYTPQDIQYFGDEDHLFSYWKTTINK